MAKEQEMSAEERHRMESRMRGIASHGEIEDRLANGEVVEVDPDVADALGATEDDAMSLEDALEARFDEAEEEGEDG